MEPKHAFCYSWNRNKLSACGIISTEKNISLKSEMYIVKEKGETMIIF